jgi:SPX domain protein involved in polyphosphate accumulation
MRFNRKEYKYFVQWEMLEPLRKRFMQYMEYDPFARQMVDHNYTVRSVYIDTPRLLFYNEKLDGIKIRKKLRVRVYNELEPNSLAFLEIKRKIEDTIFKERLKLPLAETIHLMNGIDIRLQDGYATFSEAATLEKFKYLTKRLNLKPTVLITYEREALIGIDDPSLRVTFDLNVRSYPNPQLEEIYREDDLTEIASQYFILEVKFNGRMPVWIRNVIRDFKLRIQAISKYCNGIDTWDLQSKTIEKMD